MFVIVTVGDALHNKTRTKHNPTQAMGAIIILNHQQQKHLLRTCSGKMHTSRLRAAGSSLTGVTVLCPLARHIYHCLVLI